MRSTVHTILLLWTLFGNRYLPLGKQQTTSRQNLFRGEEGGGVGWGWGWGGGALPFRTDYLGICINICLLPFTFSGTNAFNKY